MAVFNWKRFNTSNTLLLKANRAQHWCIFAWYKQRYVKSLSFLRVGRPKFDCNDRIWINFGIKCIFLRFLYVLTTSHNLFMSPICMPIENKGIHLQRNLFSSLSAMPKSVYSALNFWCQALTETIELIPNGSF